MKTTDLTLNRTIAALPEKVFDVWMDSKSPGGPWFGAARLIFNPAVDGLFYFAVEHEGRSWAHYGRFLKLDRPRLVEYTWMSEATQGLESIVSVAFEQSGDATHVTLRHLGVPDDKMGHQHTEGWTFVLNMVAQRLEGKAK